MRTIFATNYPGKSRWEIATDPSGESRETTFRASYRDLQERLHAMDRMEGTKLNVASEIVRKVIEEDHPDWINDLAGISILQRKLTDTEWAELRPKLSDEAGLRERFGLAVSSGGSDHLRSIPRQLSSDLEHIKARLEALTLQEGIPESKSPSGSRAPLFSEAAALLMTEVRDQNNGRDHPDVGTIERVAKYFLILQGDRRVDKYSFRDIQDYTTALAYIEPNVFKKNTNLEIKELKSHIEMQKISGKPGLSRSTIKNTYLDRVRRVIKLGCREAQIVDKLHGLQFKIPKRALPQRSRSPIPIDKLQDVFRLGVQSGLIADILLPLLGWVTGRRIGLLSQLQTQWFVFEEGVWYIEPEWLLDVDQPDERVGLKTHASQKRFVVNQYLAEIGVLNWIKLQKPGPLFRVLSECADPEDAAQKRMNRLFASAGLSKQKMQTFHALRNTWISDKGSELEDRISRIQAGHELTDIHERYKQNLNSKEAKLLYNLPLPEEFDASIFENVDWDAAATKKPKGGRRAKITSSSSGHVSDLKTRAFKSQRKSI